MMVQIDFHLLYSGLVSAAVLISFLLYKSATRKVDRLQARLEKLESQFEMMSSGAMGVGRRVIALESKIRHFGEPANQSQPEAVKVATVHPVQTPMHAQSQAPVDSVGETFSYTQAQRLIDQGASESVIVNQSGLSKSEVQLMLLLKRQGEKGLAVQ